MAIYRINSGAFPTTAQLVPIACTTTLKTLLQVKGIAALMFKVKSWGISFDAAAGAQGVQCELLETGTIFGTVTASVAADIAGIDAIGMQVTSTTYLSAGVNATGYNCSVEGAIVASRLFDEQIVQPTGQYAWEFSLGNEPIIAAVSALRIRVKAPAAVNAVCWIQVEV